MTVYWVHITALTSDKKLVNLTFSDIISKSREEAKRSCLGEFYIREFEHENRYLKLLSIEIIEQEINEQEISYKEKHDEQ